MRRQSQEERKEEGKSEGRREGGREGKRPYAPCSEKDLLGQVLGKAEGARAAGHDGHLQQRVGVLQVPA